MRVVIFAFAVIAASVIYAPVRNSVWSAIQQHVPQAGSSTAPQATPAVTAPTAAVASPAPSGHVHRSVPATAPTTPAAAAGQSSVAPTPAGSVTAVPVQSPVLPGLTPPTRDDHAHSAPATMPGAAPAQAVTPTGAPAPTAAAVPAPSAVASDPCQALHDSFKVQAPDGRWYPTWHPPTVGDCHFGHEHGDDPRGSPALNGRPVMFGYAAAQVGMTEAHAGFKVYRQDNISDSHAPNHAGASVLMTLHQGSSGAKRFTETHHSVAFHYVNPNDRREVHVQLLAPFGTLVVGCGANDSTMALKVQQETIGGIRQIAADKCFDLPSIPYEDWITALYVGVDAQGSWKAYVDPHFAVFTPNTYCIVSNGGCSLAYSDVRAGTGADPLSTQAQFKGAKREAYLNQVWVDNNAGSTSVWTDAHGMLVTPGTPGSIEQYIAAMSSRPQGDSIAFGQDRSYDDGSVRAPN